MSDSYTPPVGDSLVLSLTDTSYAPPAGDAITFEMINPEFSKIRQDRLSVFAIQVGQSHDGLYSVTELTVKEHVALYTHTVGQDRVASFKIELAAQHRGRYACLAGESLVDAGRAGNFAVALGVEHIACYHMPVPVDPVEHVGVYAIYVGVARDGDYTIYETAQKRHAARYALMFGEEYVDVERCGKYGLCVGQARVSNYFLLESVKHDRLSHYAIALGVTHDGDYGIYAESRREHRSRYSMLVGESEVGQDRLERYGLAVGAESVGNYDFTSRTMASHYGTWSMPFAVSAGHAGIYDIDDVDHVYCEHVGRYILSVAAEHVSNFYILADVAADHVQRFDLLLRDPVQIERQGSYALHSGQVRIVTDQPTLTHQGRLIGMRSASISADEGSFTWLARIEIGKVEEWARIKIGDVIDVVLYGEMFGLVVDQKEMARDNAGTSVSLNVLAVSPLAMQREPVTMAWDGVVDAHAVVEQLIGVVDWRLPDWNIPSGRLAAEKSDPVALARQIASAAGGVIESNPDGSLVCRSSYPVAVPAWDGATPDHVITDDETISTNESLEMVQLVDRLTVADSDVTTNNSDAVEYVPDDNDNHQGVIRVYPAPWRAVTVEHTGDEQVSLSATGEQARAETELIRIESGRGTTRYPVTGITSSSWQYADLGSVQFTTDSKELTTDVVGFSLLNITYQTRCLAWTASDVRNEDILFLVTEATS